MLKKLLKLCASVTHHKFSNDVDGSLLVLSAAVVNKAQHEYETDPELRSLLSEAFNSKKVIQSRKYRVK